MPLPPDINERIQKARAAGYSEDQIQAVIQKKYGASPAPVSQPAKPKDSLFSRIIEGTIGGGKFATGLAASASPGLRKDVSAAEQSQQQTVAMADKLRRQALQYQQGDPRREHLMQAVRNFGGASSADFEDIATAGVKPREFLSSAGKLALTAAAAKVPSNFSGKLALTRSSLAQAGLGAVHGALDATGAGKAPKDVARSALVSGATAGVVRGSLGLMGRLFGNLTKSVPEAIYKTSTRVPNRTDAELLLREGITGGRDQLKEKAYALVREAQDAIERNPAAQSATASADDILNYPPLQRLMEQASRVGEGENVQKAIMKVLPKPTGMVAEQVPTALSGAEDAIREFAAKADLNNPDDVKKLAEMAAPYVKRGSPFTILEALKQKSAIDATTAPSVFADKSTSLASRAENEVADAIRSISASKAPGVTPELGRESAALSLIRSLKDYENAKASPVPYGLGNLFQRTIFRPGIGTKGASFLYNLGKPGRAFASSSGGEATRRILLQLLRSGSSKAANQ
jgi:hypothetical protein